MPKPPEFLDLETQMEREAEIIIETLIRKAQQKIAAAAIPKTDKVDDENLFDRMVAFSLLDPLRRDELISIKALIFYISVRQRIPERTLEGMLECKFSAANIESILRQDYELAKQCLIDLENSGSMN